MLQFQPPLLKTDLKLPSQKTVLEIQLPQYEFPIRIITTPYANESRLKRYLGAENKETIEPVITGFLGSVSR
jgi:hypothetical protein